LGGLNVFVTIVGADSRSSPFVVNVG
jgi:hypothetical protein